MVALASAAQAADPIQNLSFLMLLAGIVVGIIIAAAVPAIVASRRKLRFRQQLAAASILWAAFSAGTAFTVQSAQFKWNDNQAKLLESGYYDPRAGTPQEKPQTPWLLIGGLGITYAALLLIAINARPTTP